MFGFGAFAEAAFGARPEAAEGESGGAVTLPMFTVAGLAVVVGLEPSVGTSHIALPALVVASVMTADPACRVLVPWELCDARPVSAFAACGRVGSQRTGQADVD